MTNKHKNLFFGNFLNIVLIAFYILVGALVIMLPIYYRFFKTAMPRQLPQNVIENANYFPLVCYIIVFFFWIYIFISTIRLVFYVYLQIGSLPQKSKIILYLTVLINKSISNFYNFVERLPGMSWFYKNIMKYLALFIINKLNTKKRLTILAFVLDFMPKLIFLGVFVLDTCYYHKFCYIYKIAFILFLPLFERYLRFWLDRYAMESQPYYEKFLRVYDRDDFEQEMHIVVYLNEFLMAECTKSFKNYNYFFETQCPLYKDNNIVMLHLTISQLLSEKMTGEEIFEILEVMTHEWQNEHCPLIIFGDFYNLFHEHYHKYFAAFHAFCYSATWLWIILYII